MPSAARYLSSISRSLAVDLHITCCLTKRLPLLILQHFLYWSLVLSAGALSCSWPSQLRAMPVSCRTIFCSTFLIGSIVFSAGQGGITPRGKESFHLHY